MGGAGQGGLQADLIERNEALDMLARVVIQRTYITNRHRATADDCYQTAIVAGLLAQASARRANSPTSNDVILKAMQKSVTRLLGKHKGEIREADAIADE